MALTAAQKATLKTAIAANTNTPGGNSIYAATPINQIPATADGNDAIATWYSAMANPTFFAYRTAVPTAEVFDAVTWANFTPSDAVPTDTVLNNEVYQSRQLACQTKQMNLQTMLAGRAEVDGSKANIRAGLQDALTNIPSGAGGAARAAGWTTLRDSVLVRAANRVEKLFATGGNGAGAQTAATLVYEGAIGGGDVDAARNS